MRRIDSHARILFAGDSRQLPPVVVSGCRDEIISASLLTSHTYQQRDAKFVLTVQYRQQRDPTFAAWLQTLGDGSATGVAEHELLEAARADGNDAAVVRAPLIRNVYFEEPTAMASRRTHATRSSSLHRVPGVDATREEAIVDLWDRDASGGLAVAGANRAILVTRNDQRNRWNALVVRLLRERSAVRSHTFVAHSRYQLQHDADGLGDTEGEHHQAIDEQVRQWRPSEYADDGTMPEHDLDLAQGDVCLLSSTVDRVAGLVKNRRVTVVEPRWHSVVVEIVGDPRRERHIICRQLFTVDLRGLASGIKVWRKQIPLVHAFAITLHKAQGMTLDRALLDITSPNFAHGHAFMGLGRVGSRHDLSVYANETTSQIVDGVRVPLIVNVVYREFARVRQQ